MPLKHGAQLPAQHPAGTAGVCCSYSLQKSCHEPLHITSGALRSPQIPAGCWGSAPASTSGICLQHRARAVPWERAQTLSLCVSSQTPAFSIPQSNTATGFRQTLAPTKTRPQIQGLKFHWPGKDCPRPEVILHHCLFQSTNLKCLL